MVHRLCLFCCKIFFIAKCFQIKMISRKIVFFFFVFGYIPKNILQCYMEDRAERAGGETCVFRKWFTKKLRVNHFSNFNKEFFDQQKLFSVWLPFYSKTNISKSENIFRKIFYSETNGVYSFGFRLGCTQGWPWELGCPSPS